MFIRRLRVSIISGEDQNESKVLVVQVVERGKIAAFEQLAYQVLSQIST